MSALDVPGSHENIPERGWDDEPCDYQPICLWYYEGQPDQHCELLKWEGEEVTLRPIDGSPTFTCNGSFAWPVPDPITCAKCQPARNPK